MNGKPRMASGTTLRKTNLACRIRVLQKSRDYADEEEAARLTRIIERLQAEYRRLEETRPTRS